MEKERNRYSNKSNDRQNRDDRNKKRTEPAEIPEGLVIGRNAVRELLKSGRAVDKLMVRRGVERHIATIICKHLSVQ